MMIAFTLEMRSKTYLYYSELLPGAALCFRGAVMPRSLDLRDAKMHT